MRLLTSQLLLFEANLRSKQSKIDSLLEQRDRTIHSQQETIRSLERQVERLKIVTARPQSLALVTDVDETQTKIDGQSITASCAERPTICQTGTDQYSTTVTLMRLLGRDAGDESLDDGDSAVVIEDDHHRHSPSSKSCHSGKPYSQVQMSLIKSIFIKRNSVAYFQLR